MQWLLLSKMRGALVLSSMVCAGIVNANDSTAPDFGPNDPPNQAAYMNGTEDGYPYYEVGEHVRSHEVSGTSTATLFFYSPTPIYVHSAFKVPETPNVRLHDLLGEVLLGLGGIQNIINDDGISALSGGGVLPSQRRGNDPGHRVPLELLRGFAPEETLWTWEFAGDVR